MLTSLSFLGFGGKTENQTFFYRTLKSLEKRELKKQETLRRGKSKSGCPEYAPGDYALTRHNVGHTSPEGSGAPTLFPVKLKIHQKSLPFFNAKFAIQESRGPLGPKSPKSLKMVFPGLPTWSVKKVSKKCQMTRKRVKKTTKSRFGDFFDTFLTLPTGRPGSPF